MNISLENWIRNKLQENEEMHDYAVATETIRCWIDEYKQLSSFNLNRFELPSDKQMIDIAILFNDGKLEKEKLADMIAYGQFIIDRLYENGDVNIPSSKEE